jgi:KDO2-lipid IV(A) lauroyltransferase
MLVAHIGVPITAVVQAHSDPENHALFVKQRADKGIHVVASQHGAKGALRALRSNQTVALMGDRSTGGPQVPVTFFGKTAWLPQGPWRIALVSGAALLPTFIVRRPNYNFTLDIGAPIPHPETGTLQDRMRILAQAWTHCFEARLRADPSQWAAFNDVWAAPAGVSTHVNVNGSMPNSETNASDSVQHDSPETRTGTLA